MRHRLIRSVAAALALAVVVAIAPATARPDLTLIYTQREAAAAIFDGERGLPGVRDAQRQAPIFDDWRWPRARQVAKLTGSELSPLRAPQIASRLRAAMDDYGGLVGVDEVAAGAWSAEALGRLAAALESLGAQASNVILYVSPGLVAQIGRYDPSAELPEAHQRAAIAALRRAGAVMLTMYRDGGQPMTQQEFADYPTRWLARWQGFDPSVLHLVIGPDQGAGQAALWSWARGTAAGRQIMRNGVAAYGLRTHDEGKAWLGQYRAFQSSPDAPPGGVDTYVPTRGALQVVRLGPRRVRLTLSRSARAVMRLQPLFPAPRRVVAKFQGPGTTEVTLPRDLRPGRYRIITVALGGGLREVSNIGPLVVRR
jgi:hypothetical protein